MSDGDHNKIVVGKEVSWFWKSRRTIFWWCASAPLLLIFLQADGYRNEELRMLALSGFFICLALSCDKKR